MEFDFYHRCSFLKGGESCNSPAVGIVKYEQVDASIYRSSRCRECLHEEYLNMAECGPLSFKETEHVAFELGREGFKKGLASPSILNDEYFKWVPKTNYFLHRKDRAYQDLCAAYNRGWTYENLKNEVF